MTANGPVPVYRVMLASVRVGEVQVYNVEATIVPMQMPFVLLGNSFLTRFQMKRENDVMTLSKRRRAHGCKRPVQSIQHV